MAKLTLPGDTDRTALVGTTGSGKSIAGLWLLSKQEFDRKPWVIIDVKNDEHFQAINRLQEIDITDDVPTKPGLYIVRPLPDDREGIDSFLWKVHAQEDVGLFFDEVNVMGQHSRALNTLLMQGRSKHIPMICCTQQPVKCSTYVFSEAQYFFIFNLVKKGHREVITESVPISSDYRLPKYQSYYYKVGDDMAHLLKPVPGEAELARRIEAKMPQRRRIL